MKLSIIKNFFVVIIAICLFGSSSGLLAHSGRTDGNGGHKDNKNKSGLGSYHFHCDGNPAHLHTNGYCPYSSSSKSLPIAKENEISEVLETILPVVNENIENKNLLGKQEESIENNEIDEKIKDKENKKLKNDLENISFDNKEKDGSINEEKNPDGALGTLAFLGGATFLLYKKMSN